FRRELPAGICDLYRDNGLVQSRSTYGAGGNTMGVHNSSPASSAEQWRSWSGGIFERAMERRQYSRNPGERAIYHGPWRQAIAKCAISWQQTHPIPHQ